jgi:hypothetical protein
VPGDPAIMVAQAPVGHATVVRVLRQNVQHGFLLAVGVIGTGLLLAPWRSKWVEGIAVRHGHIIGIIFIWTFATLPLPLLVRPAAAQSPPALKASA